MLCFVKDDCSRMYRHLLRDLPGSPPAKSYLDRFLVPRKPPGPPRTPHRYSIGGEPQLPPDLELHLTLDFFFVYEFHLTLLGSPRELTAQATERPLDLYTPSTSSTSRC